MAINKLTKLRKLNDLIKLNALMTVNKHRFKKATIISKFGIERFYG